MKSIISRLANADDTAIILWGLALAMGALLVPLVVSDERVIDDTWTRLATPALRAVDSPFLDGQRIRNGDPHSVKTKTAPPNID